MLPKGWKDVLLDDVAKRKSGHTPNKDYPEYWNGGIKWVSLADSSRLDKGLINQTDKEISEKGVEKSSAVLLPAGTVVLSRDAGVGKSAVLAEQMAVSQHFIAWDCNSSKELYNWYLYYWLQLKKPEFERIAVGSTIKTIGLPYFKRLRLKIPPIFEQRLIANILSILDETIVTNERLLANSYKQKKSLISLILTGQRRLPGYTDIWKKVILNEACSFHKGGGLAKDNISTSGSRSCILYGELFTTYAEIIETVISRTDSGFGFVASYGDVLIPTATTTVAVDLAKASALLVDDVAIGGDAIVIRPDMNMLAPEFLAYFLTYAKKREIAARAQGATIVHLSVGDIKNLEILVPSIAEQRAITNVFKTLSLESKAIKQEIQALKKTKQAMMQQLLTGKRRLQVPKSAEVVLI